MATMWQSPWIYTIQMAYLFREREGLCFRWIWVALSCLVTSYSPCWWGRDSYHSVMVMVEQRISNTGQTRSLAFITHIYSQPQGRGHHRQCRVTWRLHSETGWRTRASGRWSLWYQEGEVSWFPGSVWFPGLNNSMGRLGNETWYSELSKNCTWSPW